MTELSVAILQECASQTTSHTIGVLILVSAVSLPEGSPDRTTVCAGLDLQGSCPSGELIAVQSVKYGTKLTASCGLSDNSGPCCVYDGADCFSPTYTDTAQQAACSGRELCSVVSVAKADTTSCGATYPVLNHYLTIEYYCIPGKFEAQLDKTNKMNCAPSENSGQSGHPPNLIRVIAAPHEES